MSNTCIWPINDLIAKLAEGDSLATLVAPPGRHVGHNVRENLLECALYDVSAFRFGPENVCLRKQARTVLGLPNTPFPGTAQPDIVVRCNDLVHFCEVKSNRVDYARFDNVFDSKPFRAFLESVGDGGAIPWEVEQDLIKLDLYRSLAPIVGSCLFLMLDAYQGGGLSWSQVFQDRDLFHDTMRTNYVRSMTDRLLPATRVVVLRSANASARLILTEVHPAPR